jgi:hypothetical protein
MRHGSSTEFGSITRSAAAAAWVTPSDLWSAQVATGIRHGSSTECRLTGSTAPLSTCFGWRATKERNVNVARGTKERNVTRSSNNCGCSLCGILQKTGRVRVDLKSEHREGSVAIGPDAVRGRLREIQNILVLVQSKAENMSNDAVCTVTNMTFYRQRDPLLLLKCSRQDLVTHRGVTPPTTKSSGSTDCSSECKKKSMDQSGAKNARDLAHGLTVTVNVTIMTFFRHRDPLLKCSRQDLVTHRGVTPPTTKSSGSTDCSSECKKKSMDQSGAKNARDLAQGLTVTVTNMTFFRQRDPLLLLKCSGKEEKKVKNNMHLIARDRLPATRFPSAIRRRGKKKKKCHSWTTTTATKKTSRPPPQVLETGPGDAPRGHATDNKVVRFDGLQFRIQHEFS